MNSNESIIAAVLAVLNGKLAIFDAESGYCLRVVREVVEDAFGWESHEFYRRYWTETVEENTTETPWARDLQRSLRLSNYGVPADERQGGDLVFCWRMGRPIGHAGVLLAADFVLENTSTERGLLVSGCNRLSRLDSWPYDELEFFRLEV